MPLVLNHIFGFVGRSVLYGRWLRLTLLVALVWLGSAPASASEQARYDESRITALVERGHKALSSAQPDSALVYFTKAASLYSPALGREAQQTCVKAYVGKWIVCFSYIFDYPQAYEALQRAMEICDRTGLDKSHVEVSMGGMLQVLAEQSDSEELYDKAADYYTSGLHDAIAAGRLNDADRAFVNLLGLNSAAGLRKEVHEVWPEYSTLPTARTDYRRRLSHTMFHALSGDASALSRLEAQADSLPDKAEYMRLRFIAYVTASQLFSRRGEMNDATRIIAKAHRYASLNNILDGEIEAIRAEEKLLRRCGKTAAADSLRVEYLQLKERFLNSRQITKLNELRFLADLRKSAEQIESMETTMHLQSILIILFVLLGVAVGSLLWVYFTKNKSLKKAYDSLYLNLREKIEAEEKQRRQEPAEAEDDAPAPESGEPGESETGPLIDLKTVRKIMAAVEPVMKNPENFCTPDFSLTRLADMVGYNSKYVAFAIKESCGCNFSTYVNGKRVLEASSRMIKGGEWQQYTLEAVAHAVGFKSRSSFLTAFKQHTGITPSEFKRRADNEGVKI